MFPICEFGHCIGEYHENHSLAQACLTLVAVQSSKAVSVRVCAHKACT